MTRLTSLFTHTAAVAALGLLVTAPALAQSTPQPARPGIVIPAPAPQGGQQQGQGQMTPPAAAPRAEAPRAPSIGGPNNQPMPAGTNIRLELAITDTYTGAPVKKTVSLLVLSNNSGMIRTNNYGDAGLATLNVDAVAAAYQSGQVSVRITFEYTPARLKEGTASTGRPPTLNESITVVLQDGKPLMVSQSADPATDRKVTAELTATILK